MSPLRIQVTYIPQVKKRGVVGLCEWLGDGRELLSMAIARHESCFHCCGDEELATGSVCEHDQSGVETGPDRQKRFVVAVVTPLPN